MLRKLFTPLRNMVASRQVELAEEQTIKSLVNIRELYHFSWLERLVRIDKSKLNDNDDYIQDHQGNYYLIGEHPSFLYKSFNSRK